MTNRLSYADLDRMERKKCKDPFFLIDKGRLN